MVRVSLVVWGRLRRFSCAHRSSAGPGVHTLSRQGLLILLALTTAAVQV